MPKLLFAAGIGTLHKTRREQSHEHGVHGKQRPCTANAFHSVLLACFLRAHKLKLTKFANVCNGSKAAIALNGRNG